MHPLDSTSHLSNDFLALHSTCVCITRRVAGLDRAKLKSGPYWGQRHVYGRSPIQTINKIKTWLWDNSAGSSKDDLCGRETSWILSTITGVAASRSSGPKTYSDPGGLRDQLPETRGRHLFVQ